MQRFYCNCGQEVYFADTHCVACGKELGFDPSKRHLYCGRRDGHVFVAELPNGSEKRFKVCDNHHEPVRCNWLLAEDDPHHQCISCRTTNIIPDQYQPKNPQRWRRLEEAKRRLFDTLISLGLDVRGAPDRVNGLRFDFLEDQRSNPYVDIEFVLTGHSHGLITLNAAEADEGFLHTMKEQMNEPYRSLLGHFRHEVGHYYWERLLRSESLVQFRRVFGDERFDYGQALRSYYQYGPQRNWEVSFISAYASSHPFEDWAETWAHYLHITDTLETARVYGLSNYVQSRHDFDLWVNEWLKVVKVMNALNRSMGLADPYPFVLSPIVMSKLRFIDELVDSQARHNDKSSR
jgi:hypothetical protein